MERRGHDRLVQGTPRREEGRVPMSASMASSIPARPRLTFLVLMVIAGWYLSTYMFRGWVSHDEGYLALGAQRILEGGLPNIDYDEGYTGGLAFLHALSFKLWGERLSSVRIPLFLFSLGMVAVLYALCVRVVHPLLAALAVGLCVVWTLPNYFASLPSWYNLFLALFGAWALLRYMDTDRSRWLFLAGCFGGFSCLCKQTGLYYVAAALLVFAYREQLVDAQERDPSLPPRRGFSMCLSAGLSLLVLMLMVMVRLNANPMVLLHFVLPGACLSAFLIWHEFQFAGGPFPRRCVRWFRMLGPFGGGLLLPAVALAIPYALRGAWRPFFIGPIQHLSEAQALSYLTLPPLWSIVAVVPLAALLGYSLCAKATYRPLAVVLLAVVLGVALIFGRWIPIYRAVWFSVRPLVPVAVAVGCLFLFRSSKNDPLPANRKQEILLMLALAAFLSLIQYPMSFAIYFCYAAPTVVLALLYLVAARPTSPWPVHVPVLLFYLMFAALWMNPAYLGWLGRKYYYIEQKSLLLPERANLYINPIHHDIYEEVVRTIRAHTVPESYIYVGPDCSELYFLADRRCPTYNAYDRVPGETLEEKTERILGLVEKHDMRCVVINHRPEFSDPLPSALQRAWADRFTNRLSKGYFEVRW